MGKSLFMRSLLLGFTLGLMVYGIFEPGMVVAKPDVNSKFCEEPNLPPKVVKTFKMVVTAYSSTPDQTDSTPFITASGARVEDGIVANNLLPFGTKVRLPELYGDKIFVVKDRMHTRKGLYHLDIWRETREEAQDIGAKFNIKVEVLAS